VTAAEEVLETMTYVQSKQEKGANRRARQALTEIIRQANHLVGTLDALEAGNYAYVSDEVQEQLADKARSIMEPVGKLIANAATMATLAEERLEEKAVS
jgi:hypothetical protein